MSAESHRGSTVPNSGNGMSDKSDTEKQSPVLWGIVFLRFDKNISKNDKNILTNGLLLLYNKAMEDRIFI